MRTLPILIAITLFLAPSMAHAEISEERIKTEDGITIFKTTDSARNITTYRSPMSIRAFGPRKIGLSAEYFVRQSEMAGETLPVVVDIQLLYDGKPIRLTKAKTETGGTMPLLAISADERCLDSGDGPAASCVVDERLLLIPSLGQMLEAESKEHLVIIAANDAQEPVTIRFEVPTSFIKGVLYRGKSGLY